MRPSDTWITARSFDIETMVKNIRCILEDATQDEIKTGLNWYQDARQLVDRLSDRFLLSPETITGVIAALSPETKWSSNLQDAVALLDDDKAIVTTYDRNRDKAVAIKSGRINPDDHYSGKWAKTAAFYFNILSPDVETRVTLDRHAARIAHGYYLTSKESIYYINTEVKYKKTAEAFKLVAAETGKLSHVIQAITWITYRRKIVPIRYQQTDINPTDIIL